MATFYYDSYSSDHINSQWIKHLQSNAYIRDIDGIVTKNRKELESTIRNASAEQAKAINQVCGRLDDGFAEISNHLKEINCNVSELRGEINAMAAMLDWKLSLLIEEQRLTNELLGNIAQILRIPDSQKQRVYHIEQGLKYLKNAILEEDVESDFYSDAFEGFSQAEKIERKDYITLNRIGQIYLYSKTFLNIPLAEEYFLKSAREAFAEFNAGGTTASNYLSPNIQESKNHRNPFKAATAEAYLYASRCCYLQRKREKAAELAGKAFSLIPEFTEAGFEQAKYLAANNKDSEAAQILSIVISKDRFFSIKAVNDQDLIKNPSILKLLETLQKSTITKAKQGLKQCVDQMRPNSQAKEIIGEIGDNISKNSYISGMKALDLLNAKYSFKYCTYSHGSETIYRTYVNPSQSIISFLEKENASPEQYKRALKEYMSQASETNAITFGLGGGALGFIIGLFKGCTVKEFSMDWGTFFISIIICGGLGALIGFLIGQASEPGLTDQNRPKSY
jgi:hypothetical protein